MSNSKLVYSLFIFVCFVSSTVSSSYSNTSLIAHKYKCFPQQSRDLLLFKESLSSINYDDPSYYFPCQLWLGFAGYYPIMMNWNTSTDCCDWEGVTCDRSTGDVIGVDLSCGKLKGTIHPNASLFDLPYLQKLNLAYNDFTDSQIPREIGRFSKSLTHLNISNCGLSGHIPLGISLLPKLISLDLSFNGGNLRIEPNIFKSLLNNNSTHLRDLRLSDVNISWVLPTKHINISSSLTYLDLSNCYLMGSLPKYPLNLTHLTHLDLSNNKLNGTLPSWLFTLPSLEYLYLYVNMFSGEVPFNSSSSLTYMDLFDCNLMGSLPKSPLNLTRLTYLDLSRNNLNGTLPSWLFTLPSLQYLNLYDNMFSGDVPFNSSALPPLKVLYLDNNQLGGQIDEALILKFTNLTVLDLSSNTFNGEWELNTLLSSLTNLEGLDLSHSGLSLTTTSSVTNNTNSNLEELYLASCKIKEFPESLRSMRNLGVLDLSNNEIHGEIPIWAGEIGGDNEFHVWQLSLQSNRIKGPFPSSICNMSNLYSLDLSNNSFGGVIPQCFGNITSSLSYLDLKSNHFQGPFPSSICNMSNLLSLDLSNNNFGGVIPQCFGNITSNLLELNLNSNHFQEAFPSSICNMWKLYSLDLSNNNFGGEIPQCFGNFSSSLYMMDLGNNDFNGTIPDIFDDYEQLQGLILNGNQLQGELPTSLSRCHSLSVLDAGNNHLNGTFPNWLENLSHLQVLNLKSNMFHGDIATSSIVDSPFPSMQVLDLSYNRFVGQLPAIYFENFNAMRNVVRNSTKPKYLILGRKYYSVDVSMKGMVQHFVQISVLYTIVCLSNNGFEGKIPDIIGSLNSLIVLNLSHNSVTGLIPQDLGKLSEIESLDLSCNQLTGEIPQSIAELTYLEFLNLSQNYLMGRIPGGKQFNTFKGDSFGGNLNLCGFPLPKKCNENQQEPHLDDDGDEEENGFTWKVVLSGYGCGTLFGLVMGYLMLSTGRPKWFNAIADEVDRMILTRRKKRRYITYIGR